MEESLRNLVLVFVISGAILIVFQKLRLPSVVGLLIAGVLMGPHGLGVVEDQAFIDSMAKMGILLLMFSIGLDFTPDRVRELVGAAGLGVWQMLICTVVMMLASIFFVDHWGEAVFLGLMISHTSSTLMIKIFLDRGELSTPQLRIGLGISITQDLSTVPMLLALPILAGKGGAGFGDLGRMLL
ncbi:MAG TPA: cation:proton antiporter, partial [Planctomycetota bacterium]|nr:cation:proton antiporter [Planctomycetota bacterium]